MPQDATGTPTPLGIFKYNTAVDAPSGKGFNATMDKIDEIITAKQLPAGVLNNALVYSGGAWQPAKIADVNVADNAGIQHTKLNVPRCHARHSATGYSIPYNAFTNLVLTDEVLDNDTMYNPATGEITFTTAGTYMYGAWGSWGIGGNGTGLRHVDIYHVTDAQSRESLDQTGLGTSLSVSWTLTGMRSFSAGKKIVLRGYHQDGSGGSISLNAERSAEFWAVRVGPV